MLLSKLFLLACKVSDIVNSPVLFPPHFPKGAIRCVGHQFNQLFLGPKVMESHFSVLCQLYYSPELLVIFILCLTKYFKAHLKCS